MRIDQAMLVTLCLCSVMACTDVDAQNVAKDAVNFQLVTTTSAGARGAIMVIVNESPDTTRTPPGRHLATDCFLIPRIGSELVRVAGGFSSAGDAYPVGTDRFMYPIVGVYLTERNEPITIYRDEKGAVYTAQIPSRWSVGSGNILINFDAVGHKLPSRPLSAEVTGSLANRDLVITLRGDKQVFKFKFDYDSIMRHWIQVNDNHRVKAAASTQPSSAPGAATLAIGDLIRAKLISQQEVGLDAHLLTVLAEAPLPHGQGRRVAFYYFVQNSPDGSDVKFLTNSRAFEDRQPVGSGAGDDPAGKPTGKLFGSMRTMDAKFDLTVGQTVSHFIYDYFARKWVEGKKGK